MAAAVTPVYASTLDCFVVPPRNDAKRLSDAKRQSDAKRRIRKAAVRRKATLTRTYLGFDPTRASRHCMSETVASEAKRFPCFRFASSRGTKRSR